MGPAEKEGPWGSSIKTMQVIFPRILRFSALLMVCSLPMEVWGLFGAGDIVFDPTASANHATQMKSMGEQLAKASEQVARMNKLVKQTDQLLGIIGDPKSVIDSVSSLGGAANQMDYIFKSDTTRALRKIVKESDSLNRNSRRFNKTIGESVLVGGKPRKRNTSLYGAFSLLEKTKDNFDDIVAEDRKIQEREIRRQKVLAEALASAQTEWERERIKAAIAASKAMQDASSNSVLKAKSEYDSEKEAIDLENRKNALAAWEEHQLKEEYRMQNVKQSQENFQKHLDNELYGTATHNTEIEFYN